MRILLLVLSTCFVFDMAAFDGHYLRTVLSDVHETSASVSRSVRTWMSNAVPG
jgi:hypothetical protein